MRKAIEAFEKEFALWGLSLPARNVVDRQAGRMERHGWSLDYSFGTDAFGEYLEYHARRAVPEEPVIERHARVYANGEKNFVPAPSGGEPAADEEPIFIKADPEPKRESVGKAPHHPTLPPFEAMVQEASGAQRRTGAVKERRAPLRPALRPAPAESPRAAPARDYVPNRRAPAFARQKVTMVSFAVGVGAAILVAAVVVFGVKAVRGGKPATGAVADSASLEPILVLAPAVLGFSTEGTNTFTQPLVGARGDPNRAEVIRPERGMTPIIPSDPGPKKKDTRPAATTRGEKFHVP